MNFLYPIIFIIIVFFLWSYFQEPFTPTPTPALHFAPDSPQLILYYTQWCGYSRAFLPIWEEFRKQNKAPIRIDQMRCEGGNEAICNEKGLKGYPSIILYKNNQVIPFEGERTVAGLNQFVRNNI